MRVGACACMDCDLQYVDETVCNKDNMSNLWHSVYVCVCVCVCDHSSPPCPQVGMLGSRFAILMLFTRIFKQWILGVIGQSGFFSGRCLYRHWGEK